MGRWGYDRRLDHKSRMKRELPVRFREGLGVQLPRATRLVVFCETEADAQRVKDVLLPAWLAERGLALSQGKTRLVHLQEGFDFLGFTIRHFPAPQTAKTGFKLLIRPSKHKVQRLRDRLKQLWLGLKGHSLQAVFAAINPVIRGWAHYYRGVVVTQVWHGLDQWMLHRERRYVQHTHPTKSWHWCKHRYWGRLSRKHPADHWVFGAKHSGRHLLKFGWTRIIRHLLVKGTASPDAPRLRDYWWQRGQSNLNHLSPSDQALAASQHGLCPVCRLSLRNGE